MNIPMPNERFEDGIVVASVYEGELDAKLLVLRPEPPFYSVVGIQLTVTGFRPVARWRYENIAQATEDWE